jgi:ketosteroid isomerase-like protein
MTDEAHADIEQALATFLTAFNDLDWDRFCASFADDATVFFPAPPFPAERASGRTAVEAAFAPYFAALRAMVAGPPYQQLVARDLEIHVLGETAVATFHLARETGVGRRTFVLHRATDGWRIVHLHASLR